MHCYLNRVKNLGYPLPSYGETVPDTFSPDTFSLSAVGAA
jgi:hypothetical protein